MSNKERIADFTLLRYFQVSQLDVNGQPKPRGIIQVSTDVRVIPISAQREERERGGGNQLTNLTNY
jgi:hypothetical protein